MAYCPRSSPTSLCRLQMLVQMPRQQCRISLVLSSVSETKTDRCLHTYSTHTHTNLTHWGTISPTKVNSNRSLSPHNNIRMAINRFINWSPVKPQLQLTEEWWPVISQLANKKWPTKRHVFGRLTTQWANWSWAEGIFLLVKCKPDLTVG